MTTDRVRAVSFDAHGTLIHAPRMASIYTQVLARHGIEIEERDVRALAPVVWQELACAETPAVERFSRHPRGAIGFWTRYLNRLCALAEAPQPSPFAASELFDRFAHADAWEIFPDVLPCLHALESAEIERIVVSNFDQRLEPLLDNLGLGTHVSHVITSAQVGVEKPHPEIFSHAADRLGLEPAEILHVGDRGKDDVEGPQSIGMPALLLFRSGPSESADDPKPDQIDSLLELPPRLVSASALTPWTP